MHAAPVGFNPEFRVVDPRSILVEHGLGEEAMDDALLESVREIGVLAPPLVIARGDETLRLVAGRQRLAAAVEADTMLAVRVLRCSVADAVRAAVAERYLSRSSRSHFERAWDMYALQQAEIRLGRSGSVRSIARRTKVAVGKVQYLLALGRELSPQRISRLAEESEVPIAEILALTLDNALRLAAAPDAERSAVLRRAVKPPATGGPTVAISWQVRVLQWFLEWIHRLLGLLRSFIRGHGA